MLSKDSGSQNNHYVDLRISVTASRLCQCGRPCKKHTFHCGDECRFWAKVQKGEGCWLWTASQKSHPRRAAGRSYGQFTIDVDGRRVNVGAHVYAYQLTHGPIPDGMEILHSCDNPPCVNPAHLSAGTHLENVRQASLGGHMSRPRPGRQRVSDDAIQSMRLRRKNGERVADIAAAFGVSAGFVWLVLSGQRRSAQQEDQHGHTGAISSLGSDQPSEAPCLTSDSPARSDVGGVLLRVGAGSLHV